MTISVTEFKAHCLEILRRIEKEGTPVDITKHGRPRFRVIPLGTSARKYPWERLRGRGRLLAEPGESVLEEDEFDADL